MMHYNSTWVIYMSVSFKVLCHYFSKKTKNIYWNDETNAFFNDAKLITNNQIAFKKHFVYIGKTSMLQKELKNIENSSFILINDNELSIKDFFINKLNIMEIKNSEDIFETYNEIRDFFIEDVELEHYNVTLLKAFITGNGLQYIVKVASEILGNPIILIDLSYKILAYSSIVDITDPLWSDNIKKGYCSYDFVIAVRKMKSVQSGLKSEDPYEVMCNDSSILKLVSKVKIGSKHVGNIILLEHNRPFLLKDKKMLTLTSEILAEEMKKSNFNKNSSNVVYEDFICDLLENNINDSKMIEERIKIGNIKLGKNLSLCVFDISQYNPYGKCPEYLSDSFYSLCSSNNPVFYNDNIVIINDNTKLNINSQFMKKIKEFLSTNRIYLGISRDFSDIEKCRKYYLQAVRAIEIGKILNPKNPLILYTEVQLYDLVSSSEAHMDYTDFCDKALNILMAYDKKNHSDLYNTLFIYLKNNQNNQKASEELFIHRNTMRYRMSKIVELIHIDFSNIENIFKIYMSYKIINYLDKARIR